MGERNKVVDRKIGMKKQRVIKRKRQKVSKNGGRKDRIVSGQESNKKDRIVSEKGWEIQNGKEKSNKKKR